MQSGISFIVPTFNEEQYIGQCLSSIKEQIVKYDVPAEIILVDNNSQDSTIEIAKQYTSLIFISTAQGSPSITRNIGAQKSSYDILCFIDGDCLLADDWMPRTMSVFSDETIGAYGGPILSPENGNWVEKSWAPTESSAFTKRDITLAGANFSIRKTLFKSLHGFNEQLISAEDDDLSRRVMKSGMSICYSSAQSVIHLGYPKSLGGILKKQIWHGSSQIRAHGLFGDKVVILTLSYMLTFLYLTLATALWKPWHLIAAVTLFFLIPAVLVHARSRKFPKRYLSLYVRMYFISVAFLMGRAIGLIKELTRGAI